MVEYIERGKALDLFDEREKQLRDWKDKFECGSDEFNIYSRRIDELIKASACISLSPAADVAPVVHGRWIMRGGHFHCSSCDAKAKWDREGGTGGWSHEYKQAKTPYCPVCGAKMDKESDDGYDGN